ncbi:phosphopantetheine-binding protein [Actinoplanes sp. NEAU-A12]|uniref:Phosphopantetheine-binding protein n=1 Tax=Actinoplanes sandaracinus TaxID=3045177 RepID=A0ABT6WXW9_9ACTN|nr:phosphopantetheine-binding protein [Actinoplanes sandaracinus]MDI6104597.1 phosphopantetheine-binding protein [Actinoplanes sandaracinus]
MTMPTTLERDIREFVLTTVSRDMNLLPSTEHITDDSAVGAGGLDLDSLSLIELTLHLEERFKVQIPDTDIEPLGAMTLGELVAELIRRGARG